MGGYIGSRSVVLSTTAANVQDVTATDTTPEVTIVNTTHEDTDGGREGKVIFKGQQSGGEETTLAEIQGSHDGTADDEKGDLIFKTNDGSDGASPTERLRIDSDGSIITATLGTDNVHLGEGAGASIASGGNNNVAIGKGAGEALTTATGTTAIGMSAMGTGVVTGDHNTAVGYLAGNALTSGVSNTFVGTVAGDANTTGNYNTAIGRGALSENTTGTRNTAVGYQAGLVTTTGSYNTFIGWDAGKSSVSGTANVFVGDETGLSATSNNNTFLGDDSGWTVTTGGSNSILGRYSGNQGGLDIRTSSNNIVLSDGDGNPRAYYNGDRWTMSGSVTDNYALYLANYSATRPYGLGIAMPSGTNNTTQAFLVCQDSTTRAVIYANGNIVNVNNSYGAYSDQKLKENIVDSGSQWEDIKAVRVRKYSLKTDELDAPNKLGVIAQELEASNMNGLVSTEPDLDPDTKEDLGTETKSVQYSVLYMKAIKALQEAMTRIETLEAQNTTQATQIADLITRVTALEAE